MRPLSTRKNWQYAIRADRLLTRAAQQELPSRDRKGVVYADSCKLVLALLIGPAFLPATACVAQGLLKMPVVYTVPGMDSVQVTRGLVYRTDGGVALHMDVYRPPNLGKNERRPAVLFLHGGADISKLPAPTEWGVYQSYGRLMGASGMIGVTFNQRIGDPQDGLQKGSGDVRAAIEYVRSHAAELQVDPDRLCLAAYSAGGPLLAVGIGDAQPYIRCLVGFYAVMEIRPPISPERAPFSPIEQLKLHADKLPPIFLARAGKDAPGLNATIDRFVAEAASRDVPIEFHNIRGVPHAFDIQTPSPEVRSVIARVIAFMKGSLEQ
jgi:acetyl esterase/lipase